MIADLYICNDSFAHNGKDSVPEVTRKLSGFQLMLDKVRQYPGDNVLYLVREKFGRTVVFDDGRTIDEIISDYEGSASKYGKDSLTLFLSIYKHCKRSQVSLDDMKEYLSMEDEQNCSAILVLNPLEGYESHWQVLSSVEGWLTFRRYLLGKYPGDEDFFLMESKKYFPVLRIHNGTKSSLHEVLHSHHCQIVRYLSVLNDNLIPEFSAYGGINLNAFLPLFATRHNLDDSSFEGKKDSKFLFQFDDGTSAYCEPHLKMFKDDFGNSNQHCRIYFKSPHPNDEAVYVGCICRHL